LRYVNIFGYDILVIVIWWPGEWLFLYVSLLAYWLNYTKGQIKLSSKPENVVDSIKFMCYLVTWLMKSWLFFSCRIFSFI